MSVSRKVKQRTMLAIGKDWIYVCGNETHVKIKNAKTGQTKTLVNKKKEKTKMKIVTDYNQMSVEELQAIADHLGFSYVISDGKISEVE